MPKNQYLTQPSNSLPTSDSSTIVLTEEALGNTSSYNLPAEPETLRKDRAMLRDVLQKITTAIESPDLVGQVKETLAQMEDVMLKKGQDYSGAKTHTWSNFEISASQFPNGLTVDQVFYALIGTKLARLNNLLDLNQPTQPNFESVEDTWLDLANYIVLLIGYKKFIAVESGE